MSLDTLLEKPKNRLSRTLATGLLAIMGTGLFMNATYAQTPQRPQHGKKTETHIINYKGNKGYFEDYNHNKKVDGKEVLHINYEPNSSNLKYFQTVQGVYGPLGNLTRVTLWTSNKDVLTASLKYKNGKFTPWGGDYGENVKRGYEKIMRSLINSVPKQINMSEFNNIELQELR